MNGDVFPQKLPAVVKLHAWRMMFRCGWVKIIQNLCFELWADERIFALESAMFTTGRVPACSVSLVFHFPSQLVGRIHDLVRLVVFGPFRGPTFTMVVG